MNDEDLSAELIGAIADRLMAHDFQCWFYGDSVGFEGLVAASDMLDAPKWRDFSCGFFRGWAKRMTPFQPDDNTAPGHVMCDIIGRTGDNSLKAAVLDLARHLHDRRKINGVSITFEDTLRSLRQPYGNVALSAQQTEQMKDPGPGIYLDCMHFDPPFFAHLSHLDPGSGWEDRAVTEILGYKKLLFDEETGLYNHFWLEKVDRSYTRGWARGQGWALLGLLDVARYVDAHSKRDVVKDEALALARRMVHYQREDGNWWSLAHEPRSGDEASTAAFMATAFFRGIAWGLLPQSEFEEPARHAYRAMVKNLDNQGNLLGVSAAVMSALVEEHYWHVPVNKIVPWGQGPVLTAIAARRAAEAQDDD